MVEVSVVDVLFVETRIRAGEGGEYFPVRPPYVPGHGVARHVVGSVRDLLVQLAHAAGAKVVGAARGERKLDLVRRHGARLAVDYTEPDWTDRVRAETGGVDVVFDGAGGPIGYAATRTPRSRRVRSSARPCCWLTRHTRDMS